MWRECTPSNSNRNELGRPTNLALTFPVGVANNSNMEVQDLIEAAGGEAHLAALAGVHRTTVYEWKRGNFLPGHRVQAISKGLGIPADTLLALVRVPASRRQEAV